MHKSINQETIDALQAMSVALGGTGKIRSITPVRVCDHCRDESREAHPYGVKDSSGKCWQHLCNECFDSLGCSYVEA